MEDQYGMADLRQYINSRAFFPPNISRPPPELPSCHRDLTYDMLMFRSDSTTITTPPTANTAAGGAFGFEMEGGGGGGGGGDCGTARWPRQETLSLLEIRSRLDPKFKEANQKGPLWDEVSRIMCDEYGYQRSGKKCREKFENLYKYYKKTKEGKAGRQDGKHYRFFRQLEALYGDQTNNNSPSAPETNLSFHYNYQNNKEAPYPGPKLSDISLPNFSDFDTASSDGSDSRNKKRRPGKKSLKAKIKDSIDAQMRKMTEKQEAWMEKMMKIIEHKEEERMIREEEWRKQDAARIDREHKLWANERDWIKARDAALMEAFHNSCLSDDSEITRLIQLRNVSMDHFNGINSEEVSAMSTKTAHDKCNKKRKDGVFYQNHDQSICDQGVVALAQEMRLNYDNVNSVNTDSSSCFRYLFGDSYGRL